MKVILNVNGAVGEISAELRALLRYMAGEKPESDDTKRIDRGVTSIRGDEKWRRDYINVIQLTISSLRTSAHTGVAIRALRQKENGLPRRCAPRNDMRGLRQHRTIRRTHLACRIVRHMSQNSLTMRQHGLQNFVLSDENSDRAICARELCGVALRKH